MDQNTIQQVNSDVLQNFHDESSYSNLNITHRYVKSKSSQSDSDIRGINTDIHAEFLHVANEEFRLKPEENDYYVKKKIHPMLEANCGDSVDLSSLLLNDMSVISNGTSDGDQISSETYRCYTDSDTAILSSDSSSIQTKSKPSFHVERRCKIDETIDEDNQSIATQSQPEIHRYSLDGHRVVKLSTSLTSTSTSDQEKYGLARKIAFEEWMQKKKEADLRRKQEKELEEARRQAIEEKLRKEKEEKERIERENFLKWTERKKKEEAKRKAVAMREIEIQRHLKEVEDTAVAAKALCLQRWAMKKEQEQKAQQKEKEMQLKKIEEERKKRLEESAKAFEKWRETSKNKPKPATQGLLPHQKAKPAFVNPVPWQSVIEKNIDDEKEAASHGGKSKPRSRDKKVARKSERTS